MTKKYWLENITPQETVFRSADGVTVRLAPMGIVGAVVSVAESIAENPYVKRAAMRGKLNLITDESTARTAIDALVLPESEDEDHLQKQLDRGASSVTRFVDSVPDDARQTALIGVSTGNRAVETIPAPAMVSTPVPAPAAPTSNPDSFVAPDAIVQPQLDVQIDTMKE